MKNNGTGTREWSTDSFNFQIGCENGCKYCYAKKIANRFHKGMTDEKWKEPFPHLPVAAQKLLKNTAGGKTIMFPTAHDITEENMSYAVGLLHRLLSNGHNVLIVTKARMNCVELICSNLRQFKDSVEIRVTIGSTNDTILKHWEPNAPSFSERFDALDHAFSQGFKTSVSCEPMLDGDPLGLFDAVGHICTDGVWLGFMNHHQVDLTHEIEAMVPQKKDAGFIAMLSGLDNPKIHFKDSIRKVVKYD